VPEVRNKKTGEILGITDERQPMYLSTTITCFVPERINPCLNIDHREEWYVGDDGTIICGHKDCHKNVGKVLSDVEVSYFDEDNLST
jgi:hypothetical protein